MAMRKVASNVTEMLVQAAARTEVPLSGLSRGLEVDVAAMQKGCELDWNDFSLMLERLEERIGYDRLEALCSNIPQIAPTSQGLLGGFLSVRQLYRFINTRMGPMMYPMFTAGYEELPNGLGHVTTQLRDNPTLRDSHTVFKLMAPGQSSIACFIGQPPLKVRSVSGPRSTEIWVSIPSSETLLAKAGRKVQAALFQSALKELEADKARLREANEALWRTRDASLQGRLERAATKWELTDRQVDVLSGLARGLSNKELGRELKCAPKTIETHVSEVLRRSGHPSRLALVAAFWREL